MKTTLLIIGITLTTIGLISLIIQIIKSIKTPNNTKIIGFLYFILIGLLLFTFTSCTSEFSNKELECKEWNKSLDKEIESIKAGYIKLTPSKIKQIEMLELERCKL